MSDTQILVLTVTFLLAAVVVLPLTYLAYRKEKRRHEINEQREQERLARESKRRKLEEAAQKHHEAAQARKQIVADYDALKPRFKEIRYSLYASPSCANCASNLVHIVSVGADTGVLTCRCAKCSTERRIYANSKEAFLQHGRELAAIIVATAIIVANSLFQC